MRNTGHAGLDQYLARNQLGGGEARADGATVLVYDERYRVYCRPAQHGDLVLESRLADVPEEAARCEGMLRQSLELAGERLEVAAEWPVLSEDGRTMRLQQRVAADARLEGVELALEAFTNATAAWRRRLGVL